MGQPLVDVRDLSVQFVTPETTVHAVNGVSFELAPGEVLGILGESGSGKSVTLRALMRLLPPKKTRLTGNVTIAGQRVLEADESALAKLRGPTAAMIFQEPMTALDPVYTIGQQIGEAIRTHEAITASEARARALALLDRVQIPSAKRRLDAYPHQLSGGLRQRAMIAIALACKPSLLLADEPTTALDATVQIQVLLLLRSLQEELGMAMIFVTHDLGVAMEVSHRVAVMYAGRFVETGHATDVFTRPAHPYSIGLMRSTVHGTARGERLNPIAGTPPNLAALPAGCSFAPRCSRVDALCHQQTPEEIGVHTDTAHPHRARCVRPEQSVVRF